MVGVDKSDNTTRIDAYLTVQFRDLNPPEIKAHILRQGVNTLPVPGDPDQIGLSGQLLIPTAGHIDSKAISTTIQLQLQIKVSVLYLSVYLKEQKTDVCLINYKN